MDSNFNPRHLILAEGNGDVIGIGFCNAMIYQCNALHPTLVNV
jgi:hypothetical protein